MAEALDGRMGDSLVHGLSVEGGEKKVKGEL